MSEPLFLRQSRGLTLAEIADLTGATPVLPAPHSRRIVNIAPLDRAAPSDLAFFDSRNFSSAAAATHAGACLTTAVLAKELPQAGRRIDSARALSRLRHCCACDVPSGAEAVVTVGAR